MRADPPDLTESRPGPGRSVIVIAAVAVLAVAVTGVISLVAFLNRTEPADAAGQWLTPAPGAPEPTEPATPEPTTIPTVTLAATGDIIMGDVGMLPPADGDGFFDQVVEALEADLVMGNLEQPLTDDTGYSKCGEDAEACHAFRAPPRYAAHLADAGFDLLNIANNHGNDYGAAGRANTKAALEDHDLAYTGERDQITVVQAAGSSVAVVGFSPYAWTNDLNDHDQAADVVSRAAEQADLVVVQVHMGAEGANRTRVRPGVEEFYGERRGDPMAFARVVIDAGADLVVGHGPHVLRGMEFYQGRLIAYSLGNFAGGGGTLSAAGDLGLGGVLKVTLTSSGEFVDGQFISTHMYNAGLPAVDSQQRGLKLVQRVTEADFPDTGAQLGTNGEITPPSAS
jgi:hypothetical protein